MEIGLQEPVEKTQISTLDTNRIADSRLLGIQYISNN